MKKSIFAIGAAVALLASCSQKNENEFEFKLHTPAEYHGQEITLLSAMTGDTIASGIAADTTVIAGSVEAPTLAAVTCNGLPLGVVVLEPGHIILEEDGPTGTPINDEYYEMQQDMMDEDNNPIEVANEFICTNPSNPYNIILVSELGPVLSSKALATYVEQNPDMASEGMTKLLEAAKIRETTGEGATYSDFGGKSATGKDVTLSSYVSNAKYTIVDFWAPWCGPCCREIPNLEEIYQQYKSQGLEVVGAEVWAREGYNAEEKIKELGATYPIMYQVADSVPKAYGIAGIPTILVIDQSGKILKRDIAGKELSDYISTLF